MQQASYLEGDPLMWILPLYLRINKKSDDDDHACIAVIMLAVAWTVCKHYSDNITDNIGYCQFRTMIMLAIVRTVCKYNTDVDNIYHYQF